MIDAISHMRALRESSLLTTWQRRAYLPVFVMVRPEKVIRVLNQAEVRFVLVGTHGLIGYRKEVRATKDVDLLIRSVDHEKAVVALSKAYRKLTVRETPVVTRFIDPNADVAVIDLMKPYAEHLRAAFRNSVAVGESHRIPTLEMALVLKFAAMVSPNRVYRKKLIDAGDFITVVENNAAAINMAKLKKLGDSVYPGGGAELVQYVEDVKAGRDIKI